MANAPGDTLTEVVALLDNTNTPLAGATFTTLITANPTGETFPLSYTDLGTGTYRFTTGTTATSPLGEWFALVQANDPMAQVFAINWTVQDVTRPNPHYVGQELVETITLLDTDGEPVTGASWTVLTTAPPNGAVITPTWVELGSGAYRFTVAGSEVTEAGNYYLLARADDALAQSYEIEWLVTGVTTVAYTMPTSGMSRRDLRRAILGELGDLTVTTATGNSGSAQWIDVDTLAFGDSGRYAGRELFVTGGTPENLGELRGISGSNGQGTLNLTRALPAPVVEGDEAEIVNTYGGGIRIKQVHDAINTSIMRAGVEVPIEATIGDPFSIETRTIPIPPEFVTVHTVQARYPHDATCQGWRDVRRSQPNGGDGWSVERATRSIVIGGYTGSAAAEATIRILGTGRPKPMTSDNDISPVNAEWLLEDVSAKLMLRAIGGARSISPEHERKGFFRDQKADEMRDLTRMRRSPNTVRLD